MPSLVDLQEVEVTAPTPGIGHTLQLVAAMITDHKLMFISSNYSTLLSATQAAQALIYPLTIRWG